MIILLGATGYVGSAFSRLLHSRGIPFLAVSRQSCDYSDASTLCSLLREQRASFVINCAGYTGKPNVDACEGQKYDCLQGNALLPGVVKTVCEDLNVAWGHVSSGCIFTGDRSSGRSDNNPAGFTEVNPPNFSFRQNNCSFYSGTKALGEEILGYGEVLCPDGQRVWENKEEATGYLWRLRIPFNEQDSARNFLTKLMTYNRLLDARNSLSHLDEFVRACWECWERRLAFGIYNVTNPGSITTREVVELIRQSPIGKKLGAAGKQFEFFKNESEFMSVAALTPRSNCVLDTHKLSSGGIVMTPVAEAIKNALQTWKER